MRLQDRSHPLGLPNLTQVAAHHLPWVLDLLFPVLPWVLALGQLAAPIQSLSFLLRLVFQLEF
jgi:hypothetical protein